jgi:hypothetical protein
LSVEALQLIQTLASVCPTTARPVGADGAWVSAQPFVEALSEVRGDVFPAASYASTWKV